MRRGHETWLHVLVVVALVMGLAFPMLGWNWLPVAFPATGVLFAAGGAACAAGLDRADGAWAFLRQAGLRLLLPFWLFAAVVVPFMVDHGWRADAYLGSAPLTWDTGWLWLLPLADPPVSTDGLEWTPGLSFTRTFLWLVLLSPALVWLFRRWPLRLSAISVVTLVLVGTGLISLEGRAYDQVVPLCLWSCCWLLGVAWTDRSLHRAPLVRTLAVGGALTAAGAWWAVLLQRRAEGDLYDSPLATLLFSAGAVLLLLRAGSVLPRVDGLSRTWPVTAFLPGRMITVTLWTPVAVVLAPVVLARTPLASLDVPGAQGTLLEFATAVVLLLLAAAVPGALEGGRLPRFRRRRPEDRRYAVQGNVVSQPAAAEPVTAQAEPVVPGPAGS